MYARSSILATAMMLAACGADPSASAPWTIAVPDGVPVHDHAVPSATQREDEVELIEDLVLTGSGVEPAPLFYYPGYFSQVIAVDSGGHIHVLDVGNQQIESFDEHGHHLRTLGRRGQGPGELSRASKITLAGDELVVSDFPQRRLSIWTVGGVHRAAAPIELAQSFVRVEGLSGGDLVVSYDSPAAEGSARRYVSRLAFFTEEETRYAVTPGGRWERLALEEGGMMSFRHDVGEGDFAVGPDGTVYVTPGDQYQLHAFAPDGTMRWAARVDWPARAYTDADKRDILVELRERSPALTLADLEWPAQKPAVERIAVDGRGRVWVLPHRSSAELEERALRPVDVFTPAGELLYSGRIDKLWQAAHGDHVYRLDQNPESGDWHVVRYRLSVRF